MEAQPAVATEVTPNGTQTDVAVAHGGDTHGHQTAAANAVQQAGVTGAPRFATLHSSKHVLTALGYCPSI